MKRLVWLAVVSLISALSFSAVLASTATAQTTTTEDLLAGIRWCESRGHYSAVNEGISETHFDGRVGSYGAYQFGQATWDWVASRHELFWLVGIRPDRAPWWAQDAMARLLVALETHDDMEGVGNYSWRHWGDCGQG